jgi:hypothetical protein
MCIVTNRAAENLETADECCKVENHQDAAGHRKQSKWAANLHVCDDT